MKRLVLAVLLVTLATLLIPSLRQRAQPRIDASREWLGEKLEGPMGPALTPYRTLRTQTRMGEVTRLLIQDRNRGIPAPLPGDFNDYMKRRGLETHDFWGVPLIMEQEPDSLAVISAGRDLEYHSDDDIVEKIRYDAPTYRNFRRRR